MTASLAGRVALVTGGGRGVGQQARGHAKRVVVLIHVPHGRGAGQPAARGERLHQLLAMGRPGVRSVAAAVAVRAALRERLRANRGPNGLGGPARARGGAKARAIRELLRVRRHDDARACQLALSSLGFWRVSLFRDSSFHGLISPIYPSRGGCCTRWRILVF